VQYQIYSIDLEGRISGNRTIHAVDDDEAILAVRSMQRALNTEIWRGDRRVGRIAGVSRLAAEE
jgi:hypothetical protein